jgi:hypothetical protein
MLPYLGLVFIRFVFIVWHNAVVVYLVVVAKLNPIGAGVL